MTSTSHTRRKARKLATAKRTAIAAIVARNLSSPVTPKGFAPNGLATARTPWGDHNSRIGSNLARTDMTGRDARNSNPTKKG